MLDDAAGAALVGVAEQGMCQERRLVSLRLPRGRDEIRQEVVGQDAK